MNQPPSPSQSLPTDIFIAVQIGIAIGICLATYFEVKARRNIKSAGKDNNGISVDNAVDKHDDEYLANRKYHASMESGGGGLAKKLDFVVYACLFGVLCYVLSHDYGVHVGEVLLSIFVKLFPREARTLGLV